MREKLVKELRYLFPKTIPVMVGYLFLGAAYGILMSSKGFSIIWPVLISVLVFAGSLQYVSVTLLISSFDPLTAFLLALMVNARHLFYGISMLEKYRQVKRGLPYLVFGLTDETFSIVCHQEFPQGLDRDRCYLWITLLDHFYWVTGTLLGAVAGSMISFGTKGMEFTLTALFVVIFVENWKQSKAHKPAVLGVICSIASLAVFGSQNFIIPAMIFVLLVATIGYRREREKEND